MIATEKQARQLRLYLYKKLEELVWNSGQALKFLDNVDVREMITRLLRDQVYERVRSGRSRYRATARRHDWQCDTA